jgi:uncharacterized protein (TIGR02271 family)
MVPQLFGDEVCDSSGDKIGKVGQIYLDNRTGQPVWATVRTGLFGTKESFVPLAQAEVRGDVLQVPISKDKVKDAPRVDSGDGNMTPEDERRLYQYYNLSYPPQPGNGRQPGDGQQHATPGQGDGRQHAAGQEPPGPAGQQPSGRPGYPPGQAPDPTTPPYGQPAAGQAGMGHPGMGQGERDGGAAMTRSEERLKVGSEEVETGKVRLRKYVETEQQQVTVPVTHEEVRVEREPITDWKGDAPEIGEADREITLHAERPVVETETVAVEQVRLGKQAVTEDQTVSGEVRKERIDVEEEPVKFRPGER